MKKIILLPVVAIFLVIGIMFFIQNSKIDNLEHEIEYKIDRSLYFDSIFASELKIAARRDSNILDLIITRFHEHLFLFNHRMNSHYSVVGDTIVIHESGWYQFTKEELLNNLKPSI